MIRQNQRSQPVDRGQRRGSIRPTILVGSLLAMAAAWLVWLAADRPDRGESARSAAVTKAAKGERSPGKMMPTVQPSERRHSPVIQRADLASDVASAPVDEASRQMVRSLWDRGGVTSPLTAEQAAAWRKDLDALVKEDGKAVAAIAEFLATNRDTIFGPEEIGLLGYNTAREALLDALARIGGPEAIAAMSQALHATASPAEVAMLARNLEALAPGQYRQESVLAAREALVAAEKQPVAGVDVAPLFEVLQQFGGVDVAGDLERAAVRWGHYATLTLGSLPEGGGVASLLRIADASPGRAPNPARLQALQVIAQLASSNEDACAGLVALARDGRIPAAAWPYLARPLAGERARLENRLLDGESGVPDDRHAGTVHIVSGNQNLIWTRAGDEHASPEQARLIAVIKELVSVTDDPDALRILNQTKTQIESRSSQVLPRALHGR